MEGSKEVGSSSSSLASKLFGPKDLPSSSSPRGFASLFTPPSKVTNRQDSPNEPWNSKSEASGNSSKGHEGQNQNMGNRYMSSSYQEQPWNLISSVDYGSRDEYYFPPPSSRGPGLNSTYKKDGEEEDTGLDWWKGSVYY